MPASRFDGMPPRFDASQFHPEFGYLAPTMRLRRKVALTLMGALWGVLIGAGTVFYVVITREEQKAQAMLASPVLTTPTTSAPASEPPAAALSAPSQSAPTQLAARPSRVASAPPTPAPPTEPSSTPKSAPPTRTAVANGPAEVRFVPQSIALPMVAPREPGGSASPTAVSTAVEAPSMPAEPVVADTATPVVDDPPAPVADDPPAPVRQVRAAPRPRKRAVREARAERAARETRSERIAHEPRWERFAREPRSERVAREPRSEQFVRYSPPPQYDPRTAYAGQYRPYSYNPSYYRFGW
jgi:hypothetical protein